jgi:hypothetical protein
MVEGVGRGHRAQAVVHGLLVVEPVGRLGEQGIPVVLSRAVEDGCTGEGDANHTLDVAGVLDEAEWSIIGRPVPGADLAVEDSERVDVDRGRIVVLRVEVHLNIDVVLLGLEGGDEAVRWEGVGLDADPPGSFSLRAGHTELPLEEAVALPLLLVVITVIILASCWSTWAATVTAADHLLRSHGEVVELAWRGASACILELGSEGFAFLEGTSLDGGAADIRLALAATVALPSLLDLAVAVAAVPINVVAVVALDLAHVQAIAADLSADRLLESLIILAGEAWLNLAGGRASVSAEEVPIVAYLVRNDRAITADCVAVRLPKLRIPGTFETELEGAIGTASKKVR